MADDIIGSALSDPNDAATPPEWTLGDGPPEVQMPSGGLLDPLGFPSQQSLSSNEPFSAFGANEEDIPDDLQIGGPGGQKSNQPIDTGIPPFFGGPEGMDTTVTYRYKGDNERSNNNITTRMESALEKIVGDVAPEDDPYAIRSINISASTNDHPLNRGGDHPYGDALDINEINGYKITPQSQSKGRILAGNLAGAALLNPNVRFIESPDGIFSRPNSWTPWTRMNKEDVKENRDPKTGLYNTDYHVHISVFPSQQYITKPGE